MRNERDQDNKIIAVREADLRLLRCETSRQLDWLRQIENFFASCKTLEDKTVEVRGWEGRAEALRIC